ncbi:hypothetical protein [Rhizobium sp. 18055]|jgi:hypothetical protein|uniref:hypothetical protein n=1 Tax=Rhizobium sp. 18055 TaxID=2681403 RepID=UPI001357CDBD|nr:hypothetical protein [Rhizobium sp. 18055]
MDRGYRVHPLRLDKALQAYSLIHLAEPHFRADEWAELVASAHRWLIISLEDATGYVRGLAAYRIEKHPVAGELMDVPIFLAASVIDDVAIAEKMFAALRKKSAECRYMRVWTNLPRNFAEMENEDKFLRWDHGLMVKIDRKPSPALL